MRVRLKNMTFKKYVRTHSIISTRGMWVNTTYYQARSFIRIYFRIRSYRI